MDHLLKEGDLVEKRTGYPFPGVVIAAFYNMKGERRYVVECTAKGVEGCLHIFSAGQLTYRLKEHRDRA